MSEFLTPMASHGHRAFTARRQSQSFHGTVQPYRGRGIVLWLCCGAQGGLVFRLQCSQVIGCPRQGSMLPTAPVPPPLLHSDGLRARVQVRCTRIQEPPNVLTIHLKRFEFAAFGKKINRHVDFPLTLDLRKFVHPTAPKADHMCAPHPAAGTCG